MKGKNDLENVKIIRKYLDYLKERKGYVPITIDIHAREIANFEKFIGMKSFKVFNDKIAKEYKKYLYEYRKRDGSLYAIKSRSDKLKSIREFLLWLYDQPGYRSHLNINYIKYFRISRNEINTINSSSRFKKTPRYEDAITLIDSIPNTNEIDRRDKALISLSLLTGIRTGSLRSLCIRNIDLEEMLVTLDTLNDGEAKFGKYNEVYILPFDLNIRKNFVLWLSELVDVKRFSDTDPIFPITEMNNKPDHFGFLPTYVKNQFWKKNGQINKIFRERAIAAGVAPHTPYGFRRLNNQHGRKYATNMEEYSAISQNLSHSEMEIAEFYYGNMRPDKRKDILKNMRFDKTTKELQDEKTKKIDEVLEYILIEKREKESKDGGSK